MVAIAWLGVSFALLAAITRNRESDNVYPNIVMFLLSIGATTTFFAGLGHLIGHARNGALFGVCVWLYGFGLLWLWLSTHGPR